MCNSTIVRQDICESCTQEFEKVNEQQKYCKDCKEKGIKSICEHCEETFSAQKYAHERFCSEICRSEALNLAGRKCHYCREEFEATSTNQKYCSRICREEHSGKFFRNYKLTCKCCKTEFENQDRRTLYCSEECASKKKERRCLNCSKIHTKSDGKSLWCSEDCKNELKRNTCKKCDKTFYAKITKTFCSDNCRKKECKRCSKVYVPKNSEAFCSDECTTKHYTHECKACGNPFFKRAEKAVFCSKECKDQLSKAEKKYKICKNCNTPIRVLDESVNFCSTTCSDEHRKKRREKSKAKKDDNEILDIVTKKIDILLHRKQELLKQGMFYTVDYWNVDGFTHELKRRILERDEHKCYICESDKDLEVHHILCRKLGGAHEEDNLVSLCTKCHRHVETGDRAHAIKKCFKNAKLNMGTPSLVFKEKENTKEKIAYIEETLKNVYQKITEFSEDETVEVKIVLDDLIDELMELKK